MNQKWSGWMRCTFDELLHKTGITKEDAESERQAEKYNLPSTNKH